MNDLDELIKDRTEIVRLMAKRNDKSHEILAKDLYTQTTHFITELLQNAEDEGAETVEFILTENELIFSHNATKLFNFNDIEAISNYGGNDIKKAKSNAIGRFGIGFKSVYSITDSPRIVSAEFDITIHSLYIPKHTKNSNPPFFNGTKIILPFKPKEKNEIYRLLANELKDLNLHYLLFLTNIKTIKWETSTSSGTYERTFQKNNKRFVSLKSANREIKYVLFEKSTEIEKKQLTLKIAFELGNNGKRVIVPSAISPLFVFFPTALETHLKFLIHAPFHSTSSRDNIIEDTRNEKLKLKLGELLSESISVLKGMKLLTIDLLKVLPIIKDNCSRSDIYKKLYDVVKDEFLSSKKLIPNVNGDFSTAKDSMLFGSTDLADLISRKQAYKLFKRSSWVSKGITIYKTRELRDYINKELGVPEYDLARFVDKLDSEFMNTQTDSWIIQFYKAVSKAPSLWKAPNGILRTKPIIRVEGKAKTKQIKPFEGNGKPNVFLSTKKTSKYLLVKASIAKNKEANKFLNDIGLTEPDLFAELNEFIIPQMQKGEVYQDYFEDFKKIIESSKSSSKDKVAQLLKDVRECPCIIGQNLETSETKLCRYNEVYLFSQDMGIFFQGNASAFFVDTQQYSLSTKESISFHDFLRELGVKDYPHCKEFSLELSYTQKAELCNGRYSTRDYFCKDYELDGLLEFLGQVITEDKSVVLWDLLVKCIAFQNDMDKSLFFKGIYKYKYYSDCYAYFDAKFLIQLKDYKWLIINGSNKSPSEISYSSLSDKYKSDEINSKLLADILGFKLDEIEEFEKRFGLYVVRGDEIEDYKEFKKWKESNERSKGASSTIKSFIPEKLPSEVALNISDYIPSGKGEQHIHSIQINNNANKSNPSNDAENMKYSKQVIDEVIPVSSKEIGDWGEALAKRAIINEYGNKDFEIIDLNENGTGVGCDFCVKQFDEIIKLIEVKTTTASFGQPLSISGTQWELARKYYDEEQGDKYWIYCIFNAGTVNAEIRKIQNPISKWREGSLIAHPINFWIE